MNARARGDNDDGVNIHTPLECQGPAWEGPAWEGPWKAGAPLYAAAPQPHPITPAERDAQEVGLVAQLLDQDGEIAERDARINGLKVELNTAFARLASLDLNLRAEREAGSWARQQMTVLLGEAQALNARKQRGGLPAPLPLWEDPREVDAQALLSALARS
jgi:hypothetical protein